MSRDHTTTISELSETAYALWRHNPVTAAFLQFLDDQAEAYADAAKDLWIAGRLADPNAPAGMNPEMLRGRYLALTELRDLDLATLKAFYEVAEPEQDTENS